MITISRDGQEFGPYSTEDAKAMVEAGQLTRNDFGWREGESDWVPLSQLLGLSSPPAPPVIDDERIILKERNIVVTTRQIHIGGSVFVVRNVGGVSIETIVPRRAFAMLAFLFCGFIALFGLVMGASQGDEAGATAAVMVIIVFGSLTAFSASRAFKKTQYAITLGGGGGMQKALTSTDRAFVERVAAAIQQAIL